MQNYPLNFLLNFLFQDNSKNRLTKYNMVQGYHCEFISNTKATLLNYQSILIYINYLGKIRFLFSTSI
jgi:hypothetical protein